MRTLVSLAALCAAALLAPSAHPAVAASSAADLSSPAAADLPRSVTHIELLGQPAASTQRLKVGVGRADITPVTGVFKGGWACTCAKANGQHTRLFARAVVIQRGSRKVALVVTDLAMVGAGMIHDAAALVHTRGFTERNVIVSATHTHGSQSGYMNFPAYNSILPRGSELTDFKLVDTAADPVMYSFMTRQVAKAIRLADQNVRPGAVGWGESTLLGVTQNRSLEAHLANYGIHEAVGTGKVSQDPHGYAGTIDPTVNVLRVDQFRDGRRVPVGMYSTFANHGTTVGPTQAYYTADHQAAAERVVEATIRREGHVPTSQSVVNAFASSDSGDVTSGITRSGSAAADYVGRREAGAMLTAWRRAGAAMTRTPALALRWTRICLCGQRTSSGAADTSPWIGQAAAPGSEEGRTIFYDLGLAREGDKLPVEAGPQGNKVPLLDEDGSMPNGLPLTALRLGDRMVVTYPGEPTVGVGVAVRRAVAAATSAAGIKRVVLAGYAGEYVDYWTTPEEYGEQHYEGGFTVYGKYSSTVVNNALTGLARRLVSGQRAPAPYTFDENHGVHLMAANYGTGAANGTVTSQPARAVRLGHPGFSWTGGANGIDRPVDRAFVTVQRRTVSGWRPVADDLGLEILWMVDADGHYRARWEVPIGAKAGSYRFQVTAKRYQLTSQAFRVRCGAILSPTMASLNQLTLSYPAASSTDDWTYRPAAASGGRITFRVDGRLVTVRRTSGYRFAIPAGTSVTIPAGGAVDRYGNSNPGVIRVR